MLRPPVSTAPVVISRPYRLDELLVPGDVVGVVVRDEQVRRLEPMPLDRLDERLERGAAVDEHRGPSLLLGEDVGVREPRRMQASLDDHRRDRTEPRRVDAEPRHGFAVEGAG